MRLFISKNQLSASSVSLNDDQFHYVSRVIRIRVKEILTLVIDEEAILDIKFLGFKSQNLHFETLNKSKVQKNKLRLSLIQSLPKQNKFIEIIDNVTQAGVSRIYPVYTTRTVIKWNDTKEKSHLKKWNQRCLSASMQSNQNFVPKIYPILSLKECLDSIDFSDFDLCVLAWEEENINSLHNIMDTYPNSSSICVLIGPEGGITNEEVTLITSYGFKCISLGQSIFRVEIAALVCITQLLYCYDGRLNKLRNEN